MKVARERTLKLLAIVVSGAVTVASLSVGRPDLSTTTGSTTCLVLGLAALGWTFLRTGREGFVGWGCGVLAEAPRAERRLVRRARRRPHEVPEHLAPLAARYARQQADSNDRTGWLTVALVLIDTPSQVDSGGRSLRSAWSSSSCWSASGSPVTTLVGCGARLRRRSGSGFPLVLVSSGPRTWGRGTSAEG